MCSYCFLICIWLWGCISISMTPGLASGVLGLEALSCILCSDIQGGSGRPAQELVVACLPRES